MQRRNWERQMYSVLGLMVCPRPEGTVTKFETEEISRSAVMVVREYSVGPHAPSLRMRDCFVVGVLGGRKQVYSHLNI